MGKKLLLILILNLVFIAVANCQRRDTVISYYKYATLGNYEKVGSLDDCDFFRMILPPDSGEHLYNLKEFYKNGRIKLMTKADYRISKKYNKQEIAFQGNCIAFFSNGSKESIANYKNGDIDGLDYEYYPNGHLYCVKKYIRPSNEVQFLECHDKDGTVICKDGTGKWRNYNNSYTSIVIEGPVQKGLMEGEWKGGVKFYSDSITYTYVYEKGEVLSSTSHDKAGNAYSFTEENLAPRFGRSGSIAFIDEFQLHFKMPKDDTGKKVNGEDIYYSFIIEKDGSITNFEAVSPMDTKILEAVKSALAKCPHWQPRQYFGIPVRSKMILPIVNKPFYYQNSEGEYNASKEEIIGL